MSIKEKAGMRIVSVKLRRPSAAVSGKGQLALSIPRQFLPSVDKFDVVVGEIIDPGHFYLQRGRSSQDWKMENLLFCYN